MQLQNTLWLMACIVTGCSTKTETVAPPTQGSEPDIDSTADREPWSTPPPSTLAAPERLVGFADVHGDFDATVRVLTLAGLIDENQTWVGGTTVVVQTGDQLDRGDGERAILDLFESLSEQAWAAGGGFYPLLGNHEIMNLALDLRYVTPGGFAEFEDIEHDSNDPFLSEYPPQQRGRVAAFRSGGPYAQILAGHNLTMQVGTTVFVHGGILPQHAVVGLKTINEEVQAWARGEAPEPTRWVRSATSPVWSRHYSDRPDASDCALLAQALETLGAVRMVVGHTVQDAPNPDCNGKVWRMDVGMAAHYGGSPAAIEIVGDSVTLLE